MAKFFCENPDCPGYRKTILGHKVKYVLKEGKLVPTSTPKCKDCGEYLALIEERNTEIPNFGIGEFNGMSNEQKAEVLKKRHIEHTKTSKTQEEMKFHRDRTLDRFFNK